MTTPPFGSIRRPLCKGTGITPHLRMRCERCKGTGWLPPKHKGM